MKKAFVDGPCECRRLECDVEAGRLEVFDRKYIHVHMHSKKGNVSECDRFAKVTRVLLYCTATKHLQIFKNDRNEIMALYMYSPHVPNERNLQGALRRHQMRAQRRITPHSHQSPHSCCILLSLLSLHL